MRILGAIGEGTWTMNETARHLPLWNAMTGGWFGLYLKRARTLDIIVFVGLAEPF